MNPAPYDHEALWLKAKQFLNWAMDEDGTRTFDEQALWASLALELLGKAALARVSPVLIASPTEDGRNLLVATGLIQGTDAFVSIPAKSVYHRCHSAFRPFNKDVAAKVAWARNQYIHGASPQFVPIPSDAWWPQYWSLAYVLVSALNRDIEDLVGTERVDTVEMHLAQNKRNVADRVATLVRQAELRLLQHSQGTLPARVAKEWTPGMDNSLGLGYGEAEECPACHGQGILEGMEIRDSRIEYERLSDDDFIASVIVEVFADHFSCPHCGLVLSSPDLIEEAQLPGAFETEGPVELLYEDEYGND